MPEGDKIAERPRGHVRLACCVTQRSPPNSFSVITEQTGPTFLWILANAFSLVRTGEMRKRLTSKATSR